MRKLRMQELGRLSPEEFKKAPKIPITLVLDDVRSLLNVGSVFRTADAFRIREIHLCGLSPLPSREMRKTALGATESVSWQHFDAVADSLRTLKEQGHQLLAVEQTEPCRSLANLSLEPRPAAMALIFGNEVHGVSQAALSLADQAIEIPQWGTKHSLNIAVSVGIVCWHLGLPYFDDIKA